MSSSFVAEIEHVHQLVFQSVCTLLLICILCCISWFYRYNVYLISCCCRSIARESKYKNKASVSGKTTRSLFTISLIFTYTRPISAQLKRGYDMTAHLSSHDSLGRRWFLEFVQCLIIVLQGPVRTQLPWHLVFH